MTKLYIKMILNANNRFLYLIIYTFPITYLFLKNLISPMNYNILLLILLASMLLAIIVNEEVYVQEGGTKIISYLRILESETALYINKTSAAWLIVSCATLFTALFVLLIFKQFILISLFISYVIINLLFNFFYCYFLLYLTININTVILRNTIIFAVSFIVLLSLLTKSIVTYMSFVALLGLFMAITIINRRLVEQLKREEDEK